MVSNWKRFDDLLMPLVICDNGGYILYKNNQAREMDLLRVGSGIMSKMDARSRLSFSELTSAGAILTIVGKLCAYRALVFPFIMEQKGYVAFWFPEALLGEKPHPDTERMLIRMVPSLREMMHTAYPMPHSLGRKIGKKNATLRMVTLMRKMMDLYLVPSVCEDEPPVDISYFLSVLTYYFRTVYKQMGIEITVSEDADNCGYLFYDHRNLCAMLMSVLQLLIDRSGSDKLQLDVGSEAGQAVFGFKALLKDEWTMPDGELPDAFIVLSLLSKYGISYEFYNEKGQENAYMVCRLLLPLRLASPILGVRSGAKMDYDSVVLDFLSYLAG